MKKNFLKSLSLGVASLTLIASCSMMKGQCNGKCEGNKCSSAKADEANKCSAHKCSAAKAEEVNKCSSNNNCAAKVEEKKEVTPEVKAKKAKK